MCWFFWWPSLTSGFIILIVSLSFLEENKRTQMQMILFIVINILLLTNPTQSVSDEDLHGGLSGLYWSDWDGRQVCNPSSFHIPANETEVVQLVRSVAKREGKLKVVGAGHSFSSIALGDNGETMMSLDGMRRVL